MLNIMTGILVVLFLPPYFVFWSFYIAIFVPFPYFWEADQVIFPLISLEILLYSSIPLVAIFLFPVLIIRWLFFENKNTTTLLKKLSFPTMTLYLPSCIP